MENEMETSHGAQGAHPRYRHPKKHSWKAQWTQEAPGFLGVGLSPVKCCVRFFGTYGVLGSTWG